MIHKEKRSPEIIREYFELLRWKKNGCVIALAPEYVEADEVLISIKDSLALNKKSWRGDKIAWKADEAKGVALCGKKR